MNNFYLLGGLIVYILALLVWIIDPGSVDKGAFLGGMATAFFIVYLIEIIGGVYGRR